MEEHKIKKIVGTGGIGKGIFFQSYENETVGRNESRMAKLLEAKDYCKLHIVFHYLGVLLSPNIEVIPIGKVGDDENGSLCREQMRAAGMNVEWIKISREKPTMLSICIQYPDKSGCNVTSDNSACEETDTKYIMEAAEKIQIGKDTVVVALPEVPVESRIELLKYGKEQGAFCVASCGTAEIQEFVEKSGPEYCDLIALNQEETAALAGIETITTPEQARNAAQKILTRFPHLYLWSTTGKSGSILAHGNRIQTDAPLPDVKVKNTGGAGDASLAGLLTGYCIGLPLFRDKENTAARCSASELAVLMAGMSVESEDSINLDINWDNIRKRSGRKSQVK